MRVAGIVMGLVLTAGTAAQAETMAIPVRNAVVAQDDRTNQGLVNVTLTPDGQRSLAAFTRDRVGRTVHLRVDGVLLTSPTVMSPIEGAALQLSPGATGFGGLSAEDIAQRLNAAGAMQVSDDK